MVMSDNEIDDYEKCRQNDDDLIAMPPGQYGTMRIAQWSASVASCEATRCRHRASARAVLPRWPPWLMISNEKKH
jgi:hypothetical protein